MKTYVLAIELPEGSDEWWEQVAKMKGREAKKYVRDEIKRTLEHHGFACRANVVLVRKR